MEDLDWKIRQSAINTMRYSINFRNLIAALALQSKFHKGSKSKSRSKVSSIYDDCLLIDLLIQSLNKNYSGSLLISYVVDFDPTSNLYRQFVRSRLLKLVNIPMVTWLSSLQQSYLHKIPCYFKFKDEKEFAVVWRTALDSQVQAEYE